MSQIAGRWGKFLTQLAEGPKVSKSLCWSAGGQGSGLISPRVGYVLLVGWVGPEVVVLRLYCG